MKNKEFVKNILSDYIIKEIIIFIGMLFSFGVVFLIVRLSDFNWLYNSSPVTYFTLMDTFNTLYKPSNLIILIFIVWTFISLILTYKLIKKITSYINIVTENSKLLFDENAEYIKLPKELSETENNLNNLKREYEKAQRRAKENEQKKDDLIVYLAHDIKTPLTSMIGYLSLLDEIDDMPKKQRKKYTKIALEKSYKLEDLINELFDITRFNSEKIVLMKEEIDLNLMLEQIADDFYPILKENNKEIKINSSSKIIINADSNQLVRVFSNIIKNAIFYSTDKQITIDINKNKYIANVKISNKSKHIPKEKLDHLFEKFYRADYARGSKTGGSGLGLAIAKEITKLHGGDITAKSNNEYINFYITLPLNN